MFDKITASAKLYLLIFITATGLLGLGFYGIGSLKKMNDNTRTLYADRMLRIQQLLKIRFEYGTNILPMPQNIKNHTITFSEAKKRVLNAQAIIDTNWRAYKLSYETPEERLLVKQTELIKTKADEATKNLLSMLSKEDTLAIAGVVQRVTSAKTASFTLKINELIDLQVRAAREILIGSDKLYQVTTRNFILLILLSLVIALSLSLYIIKNIRNLIGDTIASRDIIKESENKYRSILENASDAIYLADNSGNFIDVSESTCKMLGYSKEELLQKNFSDIINPESLKTTPIELPASANQPIFKERTFITRDGEEVDVEIHGQRLDKCTLMGVARDVTERKKAQELILIEKALSETIVNSLPGIFYLRDEHGRALRWNKNLEEVTGYTAEEIDGALLRNYVAEEDLETLRRAAAKTFKEGYATAEVRLVIKDGRKIPYLLTQRPVYYGGQLCVLGTGIDISSRIRAEEELKASEQKYKMLFESNPMPLWIVAKDDMTVMAANDAAAKLYGYTPEELLNMDIKKLRAAKYWGQLIERYQTDINEATDFGVIEHLKKDGTKILVDIIAQDITFEGRFARLSSTNNVTEKLKAEQELRISEQNLARYNRELTLLNKINDIILRNHDEVGLYKEICRCIVGIGGYKLAWICHKPDPNADQTLVPIAAAGATDYLKEIKISLDDPQLSKGPLATVLFSGRTFVNNNVANTSSFTPWLEKAKKHGIFSSLGLPLDGENIRGALSIYSDHTNAFDKHEVAVLERLAANVSIAVRNLRTGNELIESEARFRGAFEESSIGVGIVSLKGKWLKVNRALCEMLGYDEHELLELTFQQMTHPDDLKSDLNFLQQALTGEKEYHRAEKRYFHKDGNIVWVNLNVALIRDQNNQPLYFVAQIENVTERVESQLKFQNLVENFIVGVYIVQNGKIVYVNPRLMEESGYATEDLIGHPMEQFIYKDDLALVKKMTEAREKEHIDTVRYEARFVKKDSQPIWFEVFGSRTVYEGAPALMGTMVNIAERKKAEEEIDRLTRLYRFISHINESILKSGNAIEVYEEACRIAVEIGGFRMAWIGIYNEQKDSITPIVWNGHEDGFLKAIDVEGVKVSESAIPSARAIRDGSHFYYNDIANDLDIPKLIKDLMVKMGYLSVVALPIFIGGKVVAAMVLMMSRPFFFNEDEVKLLRGMTDNITYALDKIRIVELQNQSEANLRSIFDSTDVSYLLLDTKYNIVALNQQMRDIYRDNVGITLREGDNLMALIRPERRQMMQELFDSVLRTKKASGYESSFKDGITRHFAATVIPILVGDEAVGLCISTIDITAQRNALEKLQETNENLQKHAKELAISNAELEQFAYVASHDLQEPLRMVTSFMAQLERKYGNVMDDKGKQYIHFAVDGAKRMRQIILDLLDFSRVGKTEDDMEDVNFNKLIEEVLALFRRKIEEVHASIRFENLPTIETYKTPVRQVFQNLIDNSLKYHTTGVPPVIDISCKETKTHYQFAVRDNGIGIDSAYFEKIFVIFQRLHNKYQYSGTGMGLAITKKIIENLGGKTWVESEEGKGSTFYFTILKRK